MGAPHLTLLIQVGLQCALSVNRNAGSGLGLQAVLGGTLALQAGVVLIQAVTAPRSALAQLRLVHRLLPSLRGADQATVVHVELPQSWTTITHATCGSP